MEQIKFRRERSKGEIEREAGVRRAERVKVLR